MQPIHPFPARMAPDTVVSWLDDLPPGSRVLDPMCGSGVVVRQSALRGHAVRGFDIDPLAILMSKVWTRKGSHAGLSQAATRLLKLARSLKRFTYTDLSWIGCCGETRDFIKYWFAEPQRSDLARLARAIELSRQVEKTWVCNCFELALSRIIVAKTVGASLAWDVPHSRPRKMKTQNDFDVFEGFDAAVGKLAKLLELDQLPSGGIVRHGDCRQLRLLRAGSIDAVVTSPPYLNAINYMRGHKMALVWLGYNIPFLRDIRASAVGTERAGIKSATEAMLALERKVSSIRRLPQRERFMVHKFAQDARLFLKEMRRVLVSDGLLVLVLGDSNLRGVPVYNSRIFKHLALENNFVLDEERRRPLQSNRRYLPLSSSNDALSKRMKFEIIQAYRLAESA